MKKLLVAMYIWAATMSAACFADVRVLTSESPPTSFQADGKTTGMVTDVVLAIQKEIGSTASIEMLPWVRAFDTAKSEPNVAIFSGAKTQERVDLGFTFIGPVFTRQYLLLKKKGSAVVAKNLEDVKAKKYVLGGLRGDLRSKFFADQGVKVDDVPERLANVKKLEADRIDLWITSDVEVAAMTKNRMLNPAAVEVALAYESAPSYIMISKGTPGATIDQWQKAFTKLQQGEAFKDIARKWSSTLGNNYDFAAGKGFYLK